MSDHPLTPLFEPHTVAVLGAGERSMAARVLENIRAAGFEGSLFEVGSERYPNLAALPARAELVVICAAGDAIAALLAQAAQQRAGVALLVAPERAPLSAALERAQREAVAQFRGTALRVVGPDCLGVMRARSKLNASLGRGIERAGHLALISQSAGVCNAVLDWALGHNIGFSTVASLGAALDVGVGDVLDYLALDRDTHAVLLYLEGADHPRRFISGLRALARIKPVLVVKARRHAGHGDQERAGVFDAVLRRAGAVRVATLAQLFSTAALLARTPRARGERLAVLTNASGLGALALDRARDVALPLASWSPATAAQLGALPMPERARDNPLDLGAAATADDYARALELCLADRAVDGVLALFSPQLTADAPSIAAAIAEREQEASKPILACFVGGPRVAPARELLTQRGVPTFSSPEAAIDAFRQLASYQRNRELLVQAPDVLASAELDASGARLIIEAALAQGRSKLSQLEAKAVLAAFGIGVTAAVRTHDPNEAMVAAQQIGFPVALKIDSLEIEGKSAVHGVRLNLRHAAEVRLAYRELLADVARAAPNAQVLGVTVEPMLQRQPERELSVTIDWDDTFGPAIALAAPGRRERAFALPPLNRLLALDLIEQAGEVATWPAAVSGALVRLLLRISDLACELPEVRELAIDPLLADGSEVVALDAHIAIQHVPASRRKHEHLAIAPYPSELTARVQLADGTPIELRPIRPEDAQLEIALVRDLSLETRRFRFMHALSRLTDDMLVRFTQLDYDRELGLLALHEAEGVEVPLGVARYVGDSDELGCEFAIVVADAWQKRGVASHLMRALIAAARARRFAYMHGDVSADNARMLQWMSRLGFSVKPHPEDPLVRVVTLPL